MVLVTLLTRILLTFLLLQQTEGAVWADEIEMDSDSHIIYPETSTSAATNIKDTLQNETRQLEAIAFPVGIAIGAIGAAIWPSIFPESTTSTSISGDDSVASADDSSIASLDGSSSSSSSTTGETTTTTTTTFEPRTLLENYPDCGVKGSSNRVVGGTEIVEGEYPWLCSLKYRGSHICGMTLLSGPPHDTILVGAAHCFSVGDDLQRYTITCGEHSLQKQDTYQVTLQVVEVIVHPRYVEASTSGFDIAVYKVNDAPLRGKMVPKKLWPVCLPDISEGYMGKKSWVAGWGITKTKFIRGSQIEVKGIPDIARHTDVTVVSCQDADNFDYPRGLICAAEEGRDSCQGDSGGPLIARSDQISSRDQTRYSWVGIVSFGVGCAEPGYPGAYTRSACFLGFVASQFSLKAEFPFPGDHPEWSTDCQAGASRRSAAVNRNKTSNKRNKKKKNKNRNRKKHLRDNSEESSGDTSSYIDKSELITIHSYKNVGNRRERSEEETGLEEETEDEERKVTLFSLLNKYLVSPLLSQ